MTNTLEKDITATIKVMKRNKNLLITPHTVRARLRELPRYRHGVSVKKITDLMGLI